MKRGFFTIIFVALLVGLAMAWKHRERIRRTDLWPSTALVIIGGEKATPDPERYERLKAEAERWQSQLGARYRAANSEPKRQQVLNEARRFLEMMLPDLMRCWLGTPWDFEGSSARPGEGKIACGYFVSTVLRDAGFRLNRYDLAKLPSQGILGTFLSRDQMRVRVGEPLEAYTSELRKQDFGVAIVGLDTHVGFIIRDGRALRFIHASASAPRCVVDQAVPKANALRESNYRVHGFLTPDQDVLRRWVTGERIEIP